MLEVTQTANQTVVISTDPVLTSYYDENLEPDAIIPLSGSIEMLAEDGSFLYMNSDPAAAPIDTFDDVPFNLDYTNASGEQFLTPGVVNNLDYNGRASECFFHRSRNHLSRERKLHVTLVDSRDGDNSRLPLHQRVRFNFIESMEFTKT